MLQVSEVKEEIDLQTYEEINVYPEPQKEQTTQEELESHEHER
jgi:hypothetical protein